MKAIVNNLNQLDELAKKIANNLNDNFCLELIGDIGTGKTTLTKLILKNLDFEGKVTSPSFAINNRYNLENSTVSHFDFYRLNKTGLDNQQLVEDLEDENTGVIIEWASTIKNTLPKDRLIIEIYYQPDESRLIKIKGLK